MLVQQLLDREKNPAIQTAAIKSLGRYSQESSRELIAEQLKSISFRNELAGAAVAAIEMQRNPADREALADLIQSRGNELTSSGLSAALRALAVVSQNETDRTSELELIKPR